MSSKNSDKELDLFSIDSRNYAAEHFVNLREKTENESPYYAAGYRKPYNPDDLWQKTGNYNIYETMAFDDQVNVCLQLKIDLVIGSGWDILSDDEGQKDMVDELTSMLEEDPEVTFDDQIEEYIRCAYKCGFGLGEKIFRKKEDNSLTWDVLKVPPPDSWLIHTDKFGRVEKYEQRTTSGDNKVDPKTLMHYVNNRSYQNPYGTSDLRPAYNAWFFKNELFKYYAIWAEKFASPTPVGKYQAGNAPKGLGQQLLDILKKFQNKTAIVIPKELEVDFIESKSNGEAYEKALNLMNMFIGRSLFVPDLLGFSGSESSQGGSQALGREQMNIFMKHIQKRRRTMERMINKHIIEPLVAWNYGEMDNYPKFQFKPITEDKALDYATTFITAVNGNMYKPSDDEINHFRSLIKFPEGEVERPEPAPSPFESMDGDPEDEPSVDEPDVEEAEVDESEEKKEEKREFRVKPGMFKKPNINALRGFLNANEATLLAEAEPLIDKIYDDLINQIRSKKVLANPDRIEDISLKNLKSLHVLIKKHFNKHFTDNRLIARGETNIKKFDAPLASEDFLKYLETEAFSYVGDWEYLVTRDARLAIQNAIKDGKGIESVIDFVEEDGRKAADVSLKRYARTKFTEVMNRARKLEFDDLETVQAYRYDAVMDNRTTVICSGLNNKIFTKENAPTPPLHFNCRSVLVPVSVFEEGIKPDKKVGNTPIGKFIEKNKGKGFSDK